MERKYESKEESLAVAKEALWLAWNACGGTSGYGFLQNKPDAGKDAVWDGAYNARDYAGGHKGGEGYVNADYVFGRMMKLRFEIKGDTLEFSDNTPRGDYQAWCYKYPSYAALFDAAKAAIRTPETSEAKAA
jgi:hypothetical protein